MHTSIRQAAEHESKTKQISYPRGHVDSKAPTTEYEISITSQHDMIMLIIVMDGKSLVRLERVNSFIKDAKHLLNQEF